ncbi:MAG: hypothetical protein A3J27_05690 [Candidatus Tectomicrobia bacterium RIFCSPLOWO2_12_FULL_69_37]|nr:MAG: hypothetical protein A3J27_05690 [Candidatus Tectomicrobia bacterium RIFCSPLOWO2_12_FULL_69_37]
MRRPEPRPEDRAGQHLMGGFPGTAPPLTLLERIGAGRLGGVILFKRNIESAAQLLELTDALQRAAARSPLGHPLLIAIDEEGGRVSRLSADFTLLPPARNLGRIGDPGLARAAARAVGEELRAVGVNLDFAPVLDLLTNPACAVIGDRSFGEDPAAASALGAAFAAGLQEAGVGACAKHFPGIGSMAPDPHETLPSSDLSLDGLRRRELVPFRGALAPGPPGGGVAAVMAAHALFTRIDPERPASLSPRFLRDLLRGELGFGGLAVTDDLEMGAIADAAQAAWDSLRAGADLALVCHTEELQERAWRRILEGLKAEEIPPDEQFRSLRRISEIKVRYAAPPLSHQLEQGDLARRHRERERIVGCAAHRAIRQKVI